MSANQCFAPADRDERRVPKPCLRRPRKAEAAAATSERIVVAKDHRPEGGLGSAVAETLLASGGTSLSLALRDMPGSGSAEELLASAGIDAEYIAAAARRLLDRATEALA